MAQGFNLENLLKSAQNFVKDFEKKSKFSNFNVKAEAGAGLVKVTVNGEYIISDLCIASDLLQESKEVIETLIVAAINDANHKINKKRQEQLTSFNQLMQENLKEEDAE